MTFGSKKRAAIAFMYANQFVVGIVCGFFISTLTRTIDLTEHFFDFQSETEVTVVESDLEPTVGTSCPEIATTEAPEVSEVVTKHDRILCWVLTSPQNIQKAQAVKETWGRKCDKLLFMSSANDTSLPAVGLSIGESRSLLWEKVKLSARHIYTNYLEEYDWFFKADDDTYTIFENLRHFLSPFNSSLPYFFGRHFKFENSSYYSGGSGYLLSREALRRVIELGLNKNKCKFKPNQVYEDVNMGKCVNEVDGIFGESRDEFGQQRFVPYKINEFFSGKTKNIDFLRFNKADFQLGYNCCSSEAVTFHYVSGYDMQVYEYLLYKLKILNVSKTQ